MLRTNEINGAVHVTQYPSSERQIVRRETDIEEVRRRLQERLADKRMDGTALAEATGHKKRTVQGYLSTEGRAIPADFVGDCERVGFASAQWLLTGKGNPNVMEPPEAAVRLQVIGRIADGQISPRILQAVEDLHRRAPDAGIPRAVVQWVEGLDRPDASEEAQS